MTPETTLAARDPGAWAMAYHAAPLAPHDAIRAYAHAALRACERIPLRIEPCDVDVYGSAEALRDIVRSDRVLRPWTGASEGLAWAPAVVIAARAVHDWFDHLGALRGSLAVPFDWPGELYAAARAAERWTGLAPLAAWSELAGQAGHYAHTGAFPAQRPGWLEVRP